MNRDLKLRARGLGIPLWRVAQKMEISEPTLYRWLRLELTDEKRTMIESAIAGIAQEKHL